MAARHIIRLILIGPQTKIEKTDDLKLKHPIIVLSTIRVAVVISGAAIITRSCALS